MFIRNDWYVAAWAHEVPAGTLLATAFQRDLTIVAAQQRTLDHYKTVSYVDIKADSARVHARRVLERRLAEEAG
jgi:hypothetical protein